jgi:hypothetical protein
MKGICIKLYTVKILSIALFAFHVIGCKTAPKPIIAENVNVFTGSATVSTGAVYEIRPSPNMRPYEVLGLVFASMAIEIDGNKLEMSSQEGIITLLLREAHKLGGNDIINLRVDENNKNIGSAIAIKYLNNDSTIESMLVLEMLLRIESLLLPEVLRNAALEIPSGGLTIREILDMVR